MLFFIYFLRPSNHSPKLSTNRHISQWRLLPRQMFNRSLFSVQLYNGTFCNGCITKPCLHNSRNVAFNDLCFISALWPKIYVLKIKVILSCSEYIAFLTMGKHAREKTVLWCSRCGIHPLCSSTFVIWSEMQRRRWLSVLHYSLVFPLDILHLVKRSIQSSLANAYAQHALHNLKRKFSIR